MLSPQQPDSFFPYGYSSELYLCELQKHYTCITKVTRVSDYIELNPKPNMPFQKITPELLMYYDFILLLNI